MSQDKAKLIEILKETIEDIFNFVFIWGADSYRDEADWVGHFWPLLEALDISEEDLGFED